MRELLSEVVPLYTTNEFSGDKVHPSRRNQIPDSDIAQGSSDSKPSEILGSTQQDQILQVCEEFLWESEVRLKDVTEKTWKERCLELQSFAKKVQKQEKPVKTYKTQTEGIDVFELHRRKAAGECPGCAVPHDRKECRKNIDCFCSKRVDKRTAPFPKK